MVADRATHRTTAHDEPPVGEHDHPTMIDVNKLSKADIKALNEQLAKLTAERSQNRNIWKQTVLDMLTDMDEEGNFCNTTLDIWTALHADGLEDADPATTEVGKDRDRVLKKIQAFKQKLEKSTAVKIGDKEIDLTGLSFGYKATESKLTPRAYTPEKVVEWFTNPEHVAKLSDADVKRIMAAIQHR